ncbi:MAG: S41 family peptidase [Candidatus Hodarchaeales archaeon]|jgi:hypothetical protein
MTPHQKNPKMVITQKQCKANLNAVIHLLQENYVFPEKTEELAKFLEKNLESGVYSVSEDKMRFIQILNSDCQKVLHDVHLQVSYNPTLAFSLLNAKNNKEKVQQSIWDRREAVNSNFGFKKLARLSGNIGYIDLRTFYPPDVGAGEVAVHAMNFLSNSRALIIDLRENTGGEIEMVQLLTTYLFPEDKGTFLLNRVYWRPTDHYDEFWTFPYVPGKRLKDIDIFILISKNTISAAEEFAYNLQSLNRAILIGETTLGGGHMVDFKALDEELVIQIPIGRAINPITKTNWERVGVKPDIEVSPDKALVTAHLKAFERLIGKSKVEAERAFLEWELENLKASLNPLKIESQKLKTFTGTYGNRKIFLRDDSLYFQMEDNPPRKLEPISNSSFSIVDEFRVTFFRKKTTNEITARFFQRSGLNEIVLVKGSSGS